MHFKENSLAALEWMAVCLSYYFIGFSDLFSKFKLTQCFIKFNRFENVLFQKIWRKSVQVKWIVLELCASAHSGNEADH